MLDAFQCAFIAEIAKRDGDEEVARYYEAKADKAIRAEVESNRERQRELHGR